MHRFIKLFGRKRPTEIDCSTVQPDCATDTSPHPYSLDSGVSFAEPHAYCRQLYDRLQKPSIQNGNLEIVELGGSIAKSIATLFPEMRYRNIDLLPSREVETVVCDATEGIPIETNSVDVIFSNNTFEHISKPWVVATELSRILKPGGFLFVSTVWSWRYHPVPIDYWRFSPSCLEFLFGDIAKIECNFNSAQRRGVQQGFWKNKRDSVPTDEFGGWLESWGVYFAGTKHSDSDCKNASCYSNT